MNQAKKLFQKFGTAIILVLLIIYFSFMTDNFLTSGNILNVLRQNSATGIIALGMTLVMLTGGIDLSVGAIVGITSVICSYCMVNLGLNMYVSMAAALGIGVIAGLINGFLVNQLRIPALIATLGSQTAIRGVCYIITGGYTIYGFPEVFGTIGRGYFGVIPIPVIIMIAVLIAGWYLINQTKYGRYLYAIGGNAEASRLSGININARILSAYAISGLLAAIAGIIELSRLSSGQPTAGEGYEMTAITAVVLGGISVSGGEGKFRGVIFGILIMGILSNGLVMMNVSTYYQQLIRGLVLILAVGLDQILKLNLLAKKRRIKS